MKFTFNFTNKKLLKKILAISLPVFVVGASITTYLVKTKDSDSNLVNVQVQDGIKRQVYLATNDDLLMPVTITIEKKETITDELTTLINLLKVNDKLDTKVFKPLLSKNCQLKNITIDNQTVTLNFNEAFNEYDQKLEKRLLESLVFTTLQYDELTNLKLQVEDKDLSYMPLNNTPLPSSLNKNIGINNHIYSGNSFKKSVNVFFEKNLEDNKYYIPVTVKVDDKENYYEEIINGLNIKLPLFYNLKTPNILNKLEILKYNELDENNNLNLELSNKALYDEKTVDNEVYEFLAMNLYLNDNNINSISITINDEILPINGYDIDVIEVSSIIYNEMKI